MTIKGIEILETVLIVFTTVVVMLGILLLIFTTPKAEQATPTTKQAIQMILNNQYNIQTIRRISQTKR